MSRDSMMTKTAREKSLVTKREEITQKQKIYADALLEGHTKADAARAAGYHPSAAASALRTDEVQAYLAEAREEIKDLTTIKRLDVMNIFMEAIDMARTLADPAQMINGADKLAKMMGFYAPETHRVELAGDAAILSTRLRMLSDAELLELASGRAKVIQGETLQ